MAIPNEWNFYSDPVGTPLSQAYNSAGTASFSLLVGSENALATDGAGHLLCTQVDAGTDGMWTNGAVLKADLAYSVASGVQYMRYDFSYDLSGPGNDSGCAVGFAFYDSASNKVAGVAMQYDVGAAAASVYQVTPLAEMTNLAGTVAVVAKIDLSSQTLSVWYSLAGDVSGFSESNPATNVTVSLSSFDALRFQATGDIQSPGTTDQVAVDLLRTATAWEDIILPDPAAPPSLQMQVSDSQTGAMEVADTNVISVVLRNAGGLASNVTSVLSCDASAFTVVSSNVSPKVLWPGQVLTNTFTVVANTYGSYPFAIDGLVNGVINALTNFNIAVGSHISYLNKSVAEVSGGRIDGKYEPGETIDITVVSTNDGAKAVSNIDNSLFADPAYFAISNLTPNAYSLLVVGDATSTVYRVTISPDAISGTFEFSVTNRTDDNVWADSFQIDLFSQAQPSVSPASIEIEAVSGSSGTAALVVTNSGNASLHFSIRDDSEPGVTYSVQTSADAQWVSTYTAITLNPPAFGTAEDKGLSAALPIGFEFPFYGQNYSHFFVNADGAVGLSSGSATNVGSGAYVTIPSGDTPLVAPFWGDLVSPAGSITYRLLSDRLLVSFNGVRQNPAGLGGTNLQFQVSFFKTGVIAMSYKTVNGIWLDYVTVGIQGDSRNGIDLPTPTSGTTLVFTPSVSPWITYEPSSGDVPGGGSTVVTVSAVSGTKPVGTYPANLTFDWMADDLAGPSSTDVTLDVTVLDAASVMNEWTFESDPAGLTFTEAINNGTDGCVFGAGGVPDVLTDGVGGLRSTPADKYFSLALNAPLTPAMESGTVYLRFDVDYDFTSQQNTASRFITAGFRNALNEWQTAVTISMGRGVEGSSALFRYQGLSTVTHDNKLSLAGTLSGIFAVNMDTRTMDVWYDPTGSNQFAQNAPAASNFPLGDITDLGSIFFQVQGDVSPAGTDDFITLDNLRMTKTWASAAAPIEKAPRPVYEGPSTVFFSGPSGEISTTGFAISNSGAADLEFTINNTGATSAGYTNSGSMAYNWVDTSSGTPVVFNDPDPNPFITAEDEGCSDLIPIGFDFAFYGGIFTNLSISVNGTVRLGDTGRIRPLGNLGSTATDMPDQMIAPYWGDLVAGDVRYLTDGSSMAITWSGMKQYGLGGSSNLAFQAVLDQSGAITFNYKRLSGNPWPTTPIGLRDTAARITEASLVQPGDFWFSTNSVSGYVYTNYVDSIQQRTVRFDPAAVDLIRFSPADGTVAPGSSLPISLTGDASGYSPGAGSFTNTVGLAVIHNAAFEASAIDVTFVITNGAVKILSAAIALDSDGDGLTDDAERIAGTDPQNSLSVFTVELDSGRELTWNAADGRTYTVWGTTSLTEPFVVLATGVSGGYYVDTVHADEAAMYYRISIEE